MQVPDSTENRAHFGSAKGRTQSGYPMARAVALMAVRSHLLAAARFGPFLQRSPELTRPCSREVTRRTLDEAAAEARLTAAA